jgi:uncharacterized protein YqeY
MFNERINQDLKRAQLARDVFVVTTLRGIKTALQYAAIAQQGGRDALTDEVSVAILRKEVKKRQESAELYRRGGNQERAQAELREKEIIECYLPAMIPVESLSMLVDDAIQELGGKEQTTMGQVIGLVKTKVASTAEGATIAKLVRERLTI